MARNSVASMATDHPRARKIMEISARNAAARGAQLSRLSELEAGVAKAYERRLPKGSAADIAPGVLAGLTLAALNVTFRAWFSRGEEDITRSVDRVMKVLATVSA